MAHKSLIIAFDGLDYEMVKKYNCKKIIQTEFGRINNSSGFKRRITWPLFASFVTGELPSKHGIDGFTRWNNDKIEKIDSFLNRFLIFSKWANLRKAVLESINRLGLHKRKYKKEDLKISTFLDKIPKSKAINVPTINVNGISARVWKTLEIEGLDSARREADKEFYWRKKELFREMDKDYNLLISHFHYPDFIHHLYGDDRAIYDEEELQEMYHRMDDLASEIKGEAEDKYDWILFMSDHGLPEGKEHNKNAFYSSNIKLGLNTPHITEFHSLIIEKMTSKDLSGLDI